MYQMVSCIVQVAPGGWVRLGCACRSGLMALREEAQERETTWSLEAALRMLFRGPSAGCAAYVGQAR